LCQGRKASPAQGAFKTSSRILLVVDRLKNLYWMEK